MTHAARPIEAWFTGPDGAIQRIRPGAYAWCERNGSLLLCRLSDSTPWSGSWTLPGGGLKFGEDPEAGVVRELAEETGFDGRVDGLVDVLSRVLEPAETYSGHRIQTLSFLYRVSITGGELRDEREGSTDTARWVPLGELAGQPAVALLVWAREVMGR